MNTKSILNLVKMDLRKLFTLQTSLLVPLAFVFILGFQSMAAMGLVIFLYMWMNIPTSYDELCKGDVLLCTLPLTRAEIVAGRYLYSLLGTLLCTLAYCVSMGFSLSVIVLCIALFYVSITLPLSLALGPIRARYWLFGVYLIIIVIVSLLGELFSIGPDSSENMELAMVNFPLLFLFSVALLIGSFFLALRFYSRREIG